jgi:hypothetical protein
MAQSCNPSYLGNGDQEDGGLWPAWATNLQDSISTSDWMWCLMPVILAAWERATRRMPVPISPGIFTVENWGEIRKVSEPEEQG